MTNESNPTKLLLLLITLITLNLTACATPAASTPAEPAAQAESATLDTHEQSDDLPALAPDVDVQTVAAIMDRDDVFLLDVREQWEYDEGHIPNITLIPMGTVPDRLADIPKDKELIITCRSGNRSGQIANFLREQGYTNVHNMQGGILAWADAGFPVEK